MRNPRQTIAVMIVGVSMILTTAGCKTGSRHGTEIAPIGPVVEPGPASTSEGNEIDESLFGSATGVQPVYFGYDSAMLRGEALPTLQENARKISGAPSSIRVQVQGHCDERGTQEYNLALGEKRAQMVRDHLMRLGIPGDRLTTISYGEERPAAEGHDEQAWAKNRRVDFSRAQ